MCELLDEKVSKNNFELTEEQKDIINTLYTDEQNIKINAYAGSGKTAVLLELAKEIRKNDQDCKILYVVFNRSMLEESKNKFGELGLNVECQTTHGFALKRFSAMTDEDISIIPSLDFNTFMEIKNNKKYAKSWIKFKTINELLNAFCLTYDDLDTFIGNIYKQNQYNLQSKVSINERDFFKDIYNYMIDNNLYTHGMYLKEYACNSRDKITSYKYILLDEAQDTNLMFYRILKRMKYNKLYIVGDKMQNIYQFAKTINIFDKIDGNDYNLSTSFRINNHECKLANDILYKHYHNFKKNSIKNFKNRTKVNNTKEKTILFRLNSTLFEYATNLISNADNIKVNFMDTNNQGHADGFDSCFNDMLYFYYRLLDSYDTIKANELKKQFSFSVCKLTDNYAKISKKENMSLYHYLIRNKAILPLDYIKYFNFFMLNELDIIEVLNKVRNSENCENPNKIYNLSTVHRYKGLEAENVKIAPDEWSIKTDAECNLCYVAVTRATTKMDAKPIEELLDNV